MNTPPPWSEEMDTYLVLDIRDAGLVANQMAADLLDLISVPVLNADGIDMSAPHHGGCILLAHPGDFL